MTDKPGDSFASPVNESDLPSGYLTQDGALPIELVSEQNDEVNTGSQMASGEGSEAVPGYDPDGIDVALQVGANIQQIMPIPKTYRRNRTRKANAKVQFTGPGPDKRDPQLVSEILGQVVKRRGWAKQLQVRSFIANWADLVGEVNAQHSKPESFDGSVLTIRCESSVWAQSLRLMTPQILARINSHLGQASVTEVKILGPTAPSWRNGSRYVPGRGPRDTYG